LYILAMLRGGSKFLHPVGSVLGIENNSVFCLN